jgi:hypothetical protein
MRVLFALFKLVYIDFVSLDAGIAEARVGRRLVARQSSSTAPIVELDFVAL